MYVLEKPTCRSQIPTTWDLCTTASSFLIQSIQSCQKREDKRSRYIRPHLKQKEERKNPPITFPASITFWVIDFLVDFHLVDISLQLPISWKSPLHGVKEMSLPHRTRHKKVQTSKNGEGASGRKVINHYNRHRLSKFQSKSRQYSSP